ncbi:alpha-galactosidase [Planctomycetales bacterium]|nr:alpha-galactosidase [Planctomycetales bacterium]
MVLNRASLLAETVRLEDLDFSLMSVGWGGHPRLNKSIHNTPLIINGVPYEHGIGTCAVSRFAVKLGDASHFSAFVGMNDTANDVGSIVFQVFLDDQLVWESGVMRAKEPAKKINLPLNKAKIMRLVVTDAEDGISNDHANWCEGQFTVEEGGVVPEVAGLIRCQTANTRLDLHAEDTGKLFQLEYGSLTKTGKKPREVEAYPTFGNGYRLEPALQVVHTDGSISTDLRYQKHESIVEDEDRTLTKITMKDDYYPFFVVINIRAYKNSDIFEQWVEIRNEEESTVILRRFDSSSLFVPCRTAYLTQFYGQWANEANMKEEQLHDGMKVLSSRVGIRANEFRHQSFLFSPDAPAQENTGCVLGGSLEWTGKFQLTFDADVTDGVRINSGINPLASQYRLEKGETFTTPAMLWTWSDSGKGQVSRNFHRWGRKYGLRDGDKVRPVLLNNWEATYFDFNEQRLIDLFELASPLGIDCFLLDDGWFGTKFPRNNDNAGLGDWDVNPKKLPGGLPLLVKEAEKRKFHFGIWIEPEMVNPKSELYQSHPDWVIVSPHRKPIEIRNQLILDLTRPEVQQYEWEALSKTLGADPGIAYVKWDCNRYEQQPNSFYLPPEKQEHLLTIYTHELYKLMAKMAEKFPHTTAMLCSGGGGRVDYSSLRYFHSYWPSDNTNAADRVRIQWGYGHFFPPLASCNHVTKMGDCPLDFAFRVAMSGALGMDVDLSKLSKEELDFAKNVIRVYKERVAKVLIDADLYRLESPYDGKRSACLQVSPDKSKSLLFIYQIGDGGNAQIVLRGLDADKTYQITELQIPGQKQTAFADEGKTKTGAELMEQGIACPCQKRFDSIIVELVVK